MLRCLKFRHSVALAYTKHVFHRLLTYSECTRLSDFDLNYRVCSLSRLGFSQGDPRGWWSSHNPPGEYMSCLAVRAKPDIPELCVVVQITNPSSTIPVYVRHPAWLAHRWSAFKKLNVNRLLTHQRCPYHDPYPDLGRLPLAFQAQTGLNSSTAPGQLFTGGCLYTNVWNT